MISHPKWVQQLKEDERVTFDFLRLIALPQINRLLAAMYAKPSTYEELRQKLDEHSRTGRTAYYLRRLAKFYCIQKNNRLYSLTWKGVKVLQYRQMAHSLVNLNMSNYSQEDTNQYLDIQNSQTWLEPYLEKQIKKILQCHKQSRSRRAP